MSAVPTGRTSHVRALALHGVIPRAGSHLGSPLKPGRPVLTLGVSRRRRISGLYPCRSLTERGAARTSKHPGPTYVNTCAKMQSWWMTCLCTLACGSAYGRRGGKSAPTWSPSPPGSGPRPRRERLTPAPSRPAIRPRRRGDGRCRTSHRPTPVRTAAVAHPKTTRFGWCTAR
jgi:hypothetical protein